MIESGLCCIGVVRDIDMTTALHAYAMSIGTLTAFTYVVDQNLSAIQGFRLKSRTSGVRPAGTRQLGAGVKQVYA